MGIEPMTFRLTTGRSSRLSYDGEIRHLIVKEHFANGPVPFP